MFNSKWQQRKVYNCASGLSFSMQVSEGHYCTPRNNTGPWTHVEIGFPTERVEEFMPYAEDPSNPTGTVYAWVPLEEVQKVIRKNRGLISESAVRFNILPSLQRVPETNRRSS